MKKNIKSEIIILIIALLPLLYLASIWNSLPDKVPMHWNIEGKIDRYGSKQQLIWLSLLMPLLTYLIITFIPKIDPKNQLAKMGNKYESFKFFLVLFMSILSIIIIYSAKTGELFNAKYIPLAVAGLFMVLGNYMKTIKPNYFIGIRTPWTLENEEVWKQTHYIASYLWFWGGLFSIIVILLLPEKSGYYFFTAIMFIITLIPLAYSYWYYQKIKKEKV